MTAHWVPPASGDSGYDNDDIVDVYENPKHKPKKSDPVEPCCEMWKLRQSALTPDRKPSWKHASRGQAPITSDSASEELSNLLKQKKSGVQTYKKLSPVKQQIIDNLVDYKRTTENHPYAVWSCEHVEAPDASSKADPNRAIYAYLQRRDIRGSSHAKKDSKALYQIEELVGVVTDHLRHTTMDESQKSKNASKQSKTQPNGNNQQPYHDQPHHNQPPRDSDHWGSSPQVQEQSNCYSDPQPQPQPRGPAYQPDWTQYPPRTTYPAESGQPHEQWQGRSGEYDYRQDHTNERPDDSGVRARPPIDKHNPFSKGYSTRQYDPDQIKVEPPKPNNFQFGKGGVDAMNGVHQQEPFVSPHVDPWQGRPLDPDSRFDPNQPLDWAEKQRNTHAHPANYTPDGSWSNSTLGPQSTAPTSASQGSYGRTSFEDFSSPSHGQPDYRSDQHKGYHHHPTYHGSSRYPNDRRSGVQEPARTRHGQHQRHDSHQYDQRRGRRAASPKVHQRYTSRSHSRSRDNRRKDGRYKDDYRRDRSPSSSPERRSGKYHDKRRDDYSPTPMSRAERRGDKGRRYSPRRSSREREYRSDRYDRDRSPDYNSKRDRTSDDSSEMIDKIARALRKTEEEYERKKKEEQQQEYRAKVRDEVLNEFYEQQRNGASGHNPGPNGRGYQ